MSDSYIEYLKRRIDDLEGRFGVGVRPEWVGEEIGINMMYIEELEKQSKPLDRS